MLTFSWKPAKNPSWDFLHEWAADGRPLGFLNPPNATVLADWSQVLKRWKGKIDDYCLLGIGGSALPARALITFFGGPFINEKARPRLWVIDSVDPDTLNRHPALTGERMRRALFHVVSKSGKTLEVDVLKNHVLGRLQKAAPKNWQNQTLVTTSPEPGNPLEAWARKEHLALLPLATDMGGRFCSFSPVTYTAGYFMGLDLAALSQGAQRAAQDKSAAMDYADFLAKRILAGQSLLGIFVYGDALSDFGDLLLQLFAESLGKDGRGLSPLKFTGTKDQHSLLQLYLGGPKDKMVTILTFNESGASPRRPAQVLWASQEGVAQSLETQKIPWRRIVIEKRNEETYGYLTQFFHLATIALGHRLGVNPFDQPMVELQKKFTSKLLQKGNYSGAPLLSFPRKRESRKDGLDARAGGHDEPE